MPASRYNALMSEVRCPTCGQPFEYPSSPSRPFCSVRCQQIDLGRWLGEKYGVPYEGREDDELDERFDKPERFQ